MSDTKNETKLPDAEGVPLSRLVLPLWGVYSTGMDEWQACRDEAHGAEIAKATNAALLKASEDREDWPHVKMSVKKWPFSEESHAEDLKRWDEIEENAGLSGGACDDATL